MAAHEVLRQAQTTTMKLAARSLLRLLPRPTDQDTCDHGASRLAGVVCSELQLGARRGNTDVTGVISGGCWECTQAHRSATMLSPWRRRWLDCPEATVVKCVSPRRAFKRLPNSSEHARRETNKSRLAINGFNARQLIIMMQTYFVREECVGVQRL